MSVAKFCPKPKPSLAKEPPKLPVKSPYSASNLTSIGDYKLGKHLGSGSYASVKQAIHKHTGLLTAIKIYDKQKLDRSATHKKAVLKEITILKKIEHKNLPRLYDVIDSPAQVYLVMEYVQGVNLLAFTRREMFLRD